MAARSAPAHLLVLPPGAAPRVVPLLEPVTTIGSDESCAVRLGDPEVEPVHAELRRTEGGFELVRRGAVLQVNGHRVRHRVLEPSDLITVGRTAISFRLGAPPAEEGEDVAGSKLCARLLALARRIDAGDEALALRRQLIGDLQALTGADFASFAWLDANGKVESVESAADDERRALSRTVVAKVLDEKRALLHLEGAGGGPLEQAESLRAAGVRAVVAAPVAHGGRLAGVLYLSSARPGALTQRSLDWLVVYASLVGHLLAEAGWRRELERREADSRAQLEAVRSRALVGSSPALRALLRDAQKVASSSLAVLIVGETGSGKELVARELHERSARPAGPFVAVNCGAIPEQLLESTLFGHRKGAFSGAHADQPGLIRAADGGTLFLDEIGELPLSQQAKLLRVLETREVLSIGAQAPEPVDFRLLSATHRPLEEATRAGRFREDLYYRVAGVVLRVPALRERGDDILELAEHFLARQRALLQRPALRFSAAARQALLAHPWTGNVRELLAAVNRASVLSDGDTLEPAALGLSTPSGDEVKPLTQVRDELLKEYVLEVVERHGGNRTAAAQALKVTPRTIFKYLEEV